MQNIIHELLTIAVFFRRFLKILIFNIVLNSEFSQTTRIYSHASPDQSGRPQPSYVTIRLEGQYPGDGGNLSLALSGRLVPNG